MSRIQLALLVWSFGLSSTAGAMSLAPSDPEVAPETLQIRLAIALGDARERIDPSDPVFRIDAIDAPVVVLRAGPRESDLRRASYDVEARADLTSVSRASLADLVSPGGR